MSIALTPEQEAIKKRAYDAGLEYQEAAFKWDEEDAVDYRSVSDRFGELGFFGLTAPEEWGGQGGDCVDYLLAVSEAIRAAGSWIVGEPMFCTTGPGPSMLMLSDNQALKDKYLRDVVTGVKGCAIALTEPLHGSDLTYLETTAARDGDNIIINGSKSFVTGAMYNELYACFVRFDDIPGPRGIGAVVIEADAPGFSMSRGPVFLGTRSIPHGDVEVEPVVAGYYGSSSRLTPQHEQDDDSLPSSLFLKMATENQGGRENAAQGGMYRFKVGFYRIWPAFTRRRGRAGVWRVATGRRSTLRQRMPLLKA